MVNREILRAHVRAYAQTTNQQLRDTMEWKLSQLLDAQAEFEKLHQEFIAATIHMLKDKKEN